MPIRARAAARCTAACCGGCSRTCITAAARPAGRCARRWTAPIPACSCTPATPACASCRYCATSCARCLMTSASTRLCSRARSRCWRRTSIPTCRTWKRCSAGVARRLPDRPSPTPWPTPARWRTSRWPRCSCACWRCRCRASACTKRWTCWPVPRWPRPTASTRPRSSACRPGSRPPARAGAWTAPTAPISTRPRMTPTPGPSPWTACCSATPAAAMR